MTEATKTPPAEGVFCWNELMTKDPAAARTFYTELFGYTTEEKDMGEAGTYILFKKGDIQCGGLMGMPPGVPEGTPPSWTSYIAVDDVDASTEKAKSLGATVCHGPDDIPNIGRFSILMDPTGATIALFQSAGCC